MGFWDNFFKFLKLAWKLLTITLDEVVWYCQALVKLAIAFIGLAVLLFLLGPLLAWIVRPAYVGQAFGVWFIFVGILAFVFLVFATPLLVAAQFLFKKFPNLEQVSVQVARIMAAVWFWFLMLAIYFYVIPVRNNPEAIPIVLMLTAALALGAFTGWVRLNEERVKRFLTAQLIALFLIATISFSFPQIVRKLGDLVPSLDEKTARLFEPQLKDFKTVEEVRAYRFFDGNTGKPRLYYDGDIGAEFQVFDSAGKSPFTGKELKPVQTEAERRQVVSSYVRHFEKIEADRIERELQQQKAEGEKRNQARQEEERRQKEIRETNEREERERLAKQEAQSRVAEVARIASEQAKARAEAQFLEFLQQQNDKIAKGVVPPLSVSANRLLDSWRLYFENTSETVTVNITKLRKSVNGVEETTPFTKTMRPGEREYMAYQTDFHTGDTLDVYCQGFQEPYRMVVK